MHLNVFDMSKRIFLLLNVNGGEEFSDSFDVVVFLDCAVIDDDWTSLNSFWVVAAAIVDVNSQANNLVDDNIV